MGVKKSFDKKDRSVTILLIVLLVAAIVLAGVATYVVIMGQFGAQSQPDNVASISLQILKPGVGA
jgi:flagellar basal body-associated protein FliL